MKRYISFCTKSIKIILFVVMGTGIFSLPVRAQYWSDPTGGGLCDWVNASVVYDEELIVGGRFTCAGGVAANYIAKWDGSSWSALGEGLNGWVYALTVYNGDLIAGGAFTMAGSTEAFFLAKWNGSSWTDVNGNMGNIVSALTVYNGDLIIGGYFTDADDFPANYIVGYNDSGDWFNLGDGMGGAEGQVMGLQVWDGKFYATGFFSSADGITVNHIAQWDGTSWSALGSGLSSIGYSLGVYDGNLIAGGLFNSAGGVSASSIGQWDGTEWSALGSGIGGTLEGYKYVFALTEHKGSLYAGGMYLTAGDATANGIAKWDGTTWTDMQGGVWYGGSNAYGVNTLSVFNDELYAAGMFTSAGATSTGHIATWYEPLVDVSDATEINRPIQIYPNPTSNDVTIEVVTSNAQFNLYNALGSLVYKSELTTGIHNIDVSRYNAGMYYYTLQNETKQFTAGSLVIE